MYSGEYYFQLSWCGCTLRVHHKHYYFCICLQQARLSFCSSEFHVGNDSLEMYEYRGKDFQNGWQADKNYVEKPCKSRNFKDMANQVTLKIRQSRCWRYVSYYHLSVINLLSSVSTLMLHFWSVMCVVSHSCHGI
jgi:hypothetical protein